MTRILALIPMRHHSQRVPGKNYRLLAGKPLFHHIIQTLLAVPEINGILVDTDSPPVIESLKKDFPQVNVIDRPENLRADTVPMNDILLHDTSMAEADFYLQTHSTNPLLRSETISRAIQTFLADFPAHDSLFSVTRLQTRLLPPVYEENSCLYIFTREILARRHNRLGDRPMMFEISSDEAWDIDEELDFSISDFLMRQRQN
jgi:CMP-N-acetylneuraminic acid synthetase